MISADLLNEFKPALATAIGQLQSVLRSAKESSEAELIQLKAAQALHSKSVLLLLDDVYRKAMAEKFPLPISIARETAGRKN